jgi:hypothetical protein
MNKTSFSVICFGLVVIVIAANFLGETLKAGLSTNKVQSELPSPNGQFKATVFTREVITPKPGLSTNLSVMNASDSLADKEGNVLVQEKPGLSQRWQDDYTLVVKYDPSVHVLSQADKVWIPRLGLPQQVAIKFEKR